MTVTASPSPLPPRCFFGTASNERSDFVSRQMLVAQVASSTVAVTGVRPQGRVDGGAITFGTIAKCQPPFRLRPPGWYAGRHSGGGMTEKIVVITGASSGIGAAVAERLARDGGAVALVARRADALAAVAGRCGPRALAISADMTRRDDALRAVSETIAHFGHIDVWINNVGRGITRPATELTDADIDEMMRVNVKSALYGMQAVLPHFKTQGRGHLINVSSVLGRLPMASFRSAYNGAKHFLNALTANVRDDLAEPYPGIAVSLVSPGVVRTEFGSNAVHGGPDSRTLPNSQSAEEVADVIAGVIVSRVPDVYTRAGVKQRVLGYLDGLTADPA